MAQRLTPLDAKVFIELDGQTLEARAGEPVACAMLANGETIFSRSIKYHRPRGAYCMSGACAQCLVRIDGIPNLQACKVRIESGMQIERQNAFPDAKIDLLAVNDFVFPKWFNHHEFLAGVPVAQDVMLKIARKLAGLGVLPKDPAKAKAPAIVEHIDVAIIGAGPAGLAAAHVLTDRKRSFVLFERDEVVGGRLVNGYDEGAPPVYACPAASLRLNAEVVGLYNDDGVHFLAVVQHGRLHIVFPKVMLICMGGHTPFPTFENNDLPGIYAGRAISQLIRRHQLLPACDIAIAGDIDEARSLAKVIIAAGGRVVATGGTPVHASGINHVQSITLRDQSGEKSVSCDAVACVGPMSPAFELAKSAGASVSWNERHQVFAVDADLYGRTSVPHLFVAGEIRGPMSAAAAAEQGLVAAETIVKESP